jgi:hypothetical protein
MSLGPPIGFFRPQTSGTLTLLDDLVSAWRFSNGALLDDSHGTNDLTNINTVAGASGGISGDFADFESGSSQFLRAATPTGLPTGTGAFSISFWAKYESTTAGVVILAFANYGSYFNIHRTTGWDGTGHPGAIGVNGTDFNIGRFDVDSNWHHHCILIPASATFADVEWYVDGVLFTGSGSTSINVPSANWTIGAFDDGGTPYNFYDGGLDEIYVWDRLLTPADVADLYASGSGLFYDSF